MPFCGFYPGAFLLEKENTGGDAEASVQGYPNGPNRPNHTNNTHWSSPKYSAIYTNLLQFIAIV